MDYSNGREILKFQVTGVEPAPQGSKRYVGNGRFIEASKKLAPFRAAVAHAIHSEWVRSGDERSFEAPVIVYATFFLPKPKSVNRFLPSVMPDTDKLCRALGDAMSVNSSAILDDSLIVKWFATKLYAQTPDQVGVMVSIKSIYWVMANKGFDMDDLLDWLGKHND